VVNLPIDQARAAANKDHFTLKIEAGVQSIPVAAGSVVSQSPTPGTSLKEGSTLSVVPSTGLPLVSVPSLSNLTCAQAIAALTGDHLKGACDAAQSSSTVNNGIIISWSLGSTPNPTTAPYGSTITLVPSSGHAPVPVPSIPESYSYDQALAALQAVGLAGTQANATSTSVPAGEIISTNPASGAPAPYGSTVTVTVSSGPPTVLVPNVFGDTVSQATTVLQNAGLNVDQVNGNPNGTVRSTNPAIGSTVPVGDDVTIRTN
jgi:beta-lactam-binding protein with PASTA domain